MKIQQAVFTLTFFKFRFCDQNNKSKYKTIGCVHNLASNLFLSNKMNIDSYCKKREKQQRAHAKWRGAHRQSELYMYLSNKDATAVSMF